MEHRLGQQPSGRPDPSPAARLGGMIALAGSAATAVLATIAIFRQDADAAGLALGVAMFVGTFLSIGTIACALGCMARRRLELVSLAAVAVAAGAVVAIGVGVVGSIDSEGYGRLVVTLETWSLAALLVLSLGLAAPLDGMLPKALFGLTATAFGLAAILVTRLVFSDGEGVAALPLDVGVDLEGTDLKIVGVLLAVGAAGWSATLAASRMHHAARAVRGA